MKTLDRALGLKYVVGISIAATVAPIFVLPGIAAKTTGPSIWLAYLLAALCVLPAALSKSELATAMPMSGGTYVYVDRAFGPLVGTVAGLGLWLSFLLKSSFALVGLGAYLTIMVDAPQRPVAFAFLVAIVALNSVGVRKASQVLLAVSAVSVSALVALVVVARVAGPEAPPTEFFQGGAGGFASAAAYVFMSYAGLTKVAAIAEEVRDPGRNLPRGILLSLTFVAILYALVVSTLVAVLPVESLFEDERPIHTLAYAAFGEGPAMVFALIGVVTMASMANAGVMAASRFPFAMARDRLLPDSVARVNQRFLTPVTAIFLTGATMALAIAFLDIEGIAKLASGFKVAIFALINLAVIVLRESSAPWYKPSYRSPLYPLVQIFGLVAAGLLLTVLGWGTLGGMVAATAPGFLLYFAYGRKRAERLGQLAKVGRRKDLVLQDASGEESADDVLIDGAAVVVLLLGKERSPEVLVEIGAALADGRLVEVVYLTEVPEQTPFDAVDEEEPFIRALQRRVQTTAVEKNINLHFDAVGSRDVVETAYDLANRLHCDWLVLEWRGRGRNRFLFLSPLGWLINHLPCKLALFKDDGVRYFRHILVDAEPGPDDSLVVSTADHLAELEGAELTFVRHVATDAPETAVQGQADYIDQLRDLCATPTHSLIVRGGERDEAVGDVAGLYDLLVTSAPPGAGSGWDIFRASGKDLLKERAACSVLSLKNPRVLSHGAHAARIGGEGEGHERIDPMEYVDVSCVQARLDLQRKDALFQRFASSFAQSVPGVEAEAVTAALWERERAQNTSVGDGVALPHATIPRAAKPRIGIFTTLSPVDWQGPDGAPVDVFFVTLGPPSERQTHLLLLSTIATLVLKTPLLVELRAAESREDLVAALQRAFDSLGS